MGDGMKFTNDETREIIHALEEYMAKYYNDYYDGDPAVDNCRKSIEKTIKKFRKYLKETQTQEDKEYIERYNKNITKLGFWGHTEP
tara:strand:- start:269 stop:526 length:258 start_codon:yes stop_codon:yes gene_type:complete